MTIHTQFSIVEGRKMTAETSCAKTCHWLKQQQNSFFSHQLTPRVTAETSCAKNGKWLMQKILFYTQLVRHGGAAENSWAKTGKWLMQEIPFYSHQLRQGVTAETSCAKTATDLSSSRTLFYLIGWRKEWLQVPLTWRIASDCCTKYQFVLTSWGRERLQRPLARRLASDCCTWSNSAPSRWCNRSSDSSWLWLSVSSYG